MPMTACTVCGAPGIGGRCAAHPRVRQQRGYRGLASYRTFKDAILERDGGICAICGRAGANDLGHRTPYRDMDPAMRDDPTQWDPADFAAVHTDCNQRLGANPMEDRPR